jgi:hypothetical protein
VGLGVSSVWVIWVDELQLTLACDGDSLVFEVDVISLNSYTLA